MAPPDKDDSTSVVLTTDAMQAKIDEIGFGWFQFLALLLTGGVMFSEGSEMLVMGSITTLLHDHWELTAFVRGFMVSVVFIGFSVGNLMSGAIGDRFGRRWSILISYIMIGIFGMLTATASSPMVMVTFRFCVGVGCGVGFPSVYSLIPEVCPTHLRGGMSALMIGFMPLGELFAAVGVLLIDPNLSGTTGHCEYGFKPALMAPAQCSWRTLCEYSAIPAFLFFTASVFCLWESPHWLATKGRVAEVNRTIDTMSRWNGKPHVRGNFVAVGGGMVPTTQAAPSYSWTAAMGRLFSARYISTTVFMFAAHFTKDFSVFGLAYVFPQFFKSLANLPAGMELCIVAALALPGVLLALGLTRLQMIGHITSMQLTSFLCACFTLGLLEAAPSWAAGPCAYTVKFLALAYFICTVVYTAEVFPTVIRNSAVGLCTCMGRAGSISAPLLFEYSHEYSNGSFDVFMWCLMGFMLTICAFARCCLRFEPKGQALLDDDETASGKTKGYGSA